MKLKMLAKLGFSLTILLPLFGYMPTPATLVAEYVAETTDISEDLSHITADIGHGNESAISAQTISNSPKTRIYDQNTLKIFNVGSRTCLIPKKAKEFLESGIVMSTNSNGTRNNISIEYFDYTDPNMLDEVAALPGYSKISSSEIEGSFIWHTHAYFYEHGTAIVYVKQIWSELDDGTYVFTLVSDESVFDELCNELSSIALSLR